MRRVSVVSVAVVVALAFAGAAWAGSPLDGLEVGMQLTPMTLGGYSDACSGTGSETGVTALSTVTGVSTVAPSASGWTAATTPPPWVTPPGAPPAPPLPSSQALLVWNAGGLFFLDSQFDVLSPAGDRYAVSAVAPRFFTGCGSDLTGAASGTTTTYSVYWTATPRDAVGLPSSPADWEGCGTLAVTAGAGGAYALGFTTTSGRTFDFTQPFTCPPGFAAADATPPTLTVPAAVGADATGPNGARVTYSATATDAVDGAVTPDCSPASGSTFSIGDTTVSCTATDASGNSASGSFTVTVVDTTPPVLTLPADKVVDATGPGGATVSYTATATDTVDKAPAVVCTPPSGSVFAIGTTTVNCAATDASGNATKATFTVHVKGAAEQLADLAAAVKGVGPGKSLAATVEIAQWFLAHGQPRLTCLTLTAFQLEVRAQSGKKIPAAQAAVLIADANRIKNMLGCMR